MKKLLLTPFMVAISLFAFAQSDSEEIDLVQSMFGMEKKAVAADFMELEDQAQAGKFWSLYDEYEITRKALGKKRFELIDRYAASYNSADDEKIDQLIQDMTNMQAQTDRLIVDYYKKIKKNCGVKPAAQFYQFEYYILSNIRSEIMERIPLIGELEKK